MLFDPKWKTKHDTKSFARFIAWLEQQPPRKKYDYYDCSGHCLIGQYMTAIGVSSDDYGEFHDAGGDFLNNFGMVAAILPRTFGAALKRAKLAAVGKLSPQDAQRNGAAG